MRERKRASGGKEERLSWVELESKELETNKSVRVIDGLGLNLNA